MVAETMNAAGVETEIVQIGTAPVQGCIGCRACLKTGRCGMNDELYNYIYNQLDEIGGIVIGSPTYFAGPNGALCSLLDRLYYSAGAKLAYKPGATIAVARRGGASTTLDRLNKYITYNKQPLVSSFYWNMIYGMRPGELWAVRGPSLGPSASEFVNFEAEWGPDFLPWYDETQRTMDLWRLAKDQLCRAGLLPGRVLGLDICTFDNREMFFSYRGFRKLGIEDGRQASFIWIR